MNGVVELPFGLPTSVGGVPFADANNAVEFALGTQRSFPSVPLLRGEGATLMDQVSSLIPGSWVSELGLIQFDPARANEPLSIDPGHLRHLDGPFAPMAKFLDALRASEVTDDERFIGVRLNVPGPVSVTLALTSAGVSPDIAMELAVEATSTIATSLLLRLRSTVDRRLVAVVLSEPGLIGSMHPTFPLMAVDVRALLTTIIDRLDLHRHRGPLLIGAHVPGRSDWRTIIASGVSLLSLPVGANLSGSAAELQSFLEAGGMIAWGAVPVDEPLGAGEELLWRRLSSEWCELVGAGIDPFRIRAQSLVSTADGLGHFGREQAMHALALVDALAVRVRRQATGTKLSLGA